MNLITDPPPALYLFLFAALIAAAAVAAQRQNRKSVAALVLVASLLAGIYVLDRFLDSPREAAVKSAQAMAAAADAHNADEFVKHAADPLTYYGDGPPKTATRAELKASPFWNMLRQFNAHIAVWNFSRGDAKVIDDDTVEIGFMAKGERRGSMDQIQLYVRATFRRQPDGQMRMSEFRTFDAINHDKPFNIPSFPK